MVAMNQPPKQWDDCNEEKVRRVYKMIADVIMTQADDFTTNELLSLMVKLLNVSTNSTTALLGMEERPDASSTDT